MKISNSEVSTFLKCERRHYYAHGLNLAPNHYGMSLTRGIIGHEALEAYYNVLFVQQPEKQARDAAQEVILKYVRQGGDVPMLSSLSVLLNEYFDDVASKDDFVIIAVERVMTMPLGEDIDFAMRYDLLVEMKSGPYAGEIVLIDHKFVYNFWTPDNLMLNMQAPKYIATLRASEIPVKRMMINQLRWREVKSNPERFRREYITPVAAEIKQVLTEQYVASVRIKEKMQDLTEYGATALRTMDNMTCQNCSFVMLCRVELIGQDPTLLIQTEFKPNDYGYNNESDDPNGA